MMTVTRGILDSIPLVLERDTLLAKARAKPGSSTAEILFQLATQAEAIARPKAAFRLAFIEARGENWVRAEGVELTSRVLRVNLETAQRIFICLATAGGELEAWARSKEDLLEHYLADMISEIAVQTAFQALSDYLDQRFQLAKTGFMSPGSLEDWPLPQQRPLFDLLAGDDAQIGVRLSKEYLMLPLKTISGLRFPIEETFVSCQLCPRLNCPNRRAPYEEGLYARKYQNG